MTTRTRMYRQPFDTPTRAWRIAGMGLAGALLAACAGTPPETVGAPKAGLAGSAWKLVSFTSSSDAVGVVKPQTPDQFQLAFGADSKATFQFDCNRGSGSWQADDTQSASGSLRFGAVATTRAMCPQQAMSARLPGDIESIRSYRIVGDRLFLSLMADGGTYEWSRRP